MERTRAELISDTLRNLRRYYGLPQKFLASSLGISQAAYSKMEAGGIRISQGHLSRIADVYGLPLDAVTEKTSDEIIRSIIDEKLLPPPRFMVRESQIR